jgi:hypothetical protein
MVEYRGVWGEQKFEGLIVRLHFLETLAKDELARRGLSTDQVVNDPVVFQDILHAVRASGRLIAPPVRPAGAFRPRKSRLRSVGVLAGFVALAFVAGAFAMYLFGAARSPKLEPLPHDVVFKYPLTEKFYREFLISSREVSDLARASKTIEQYVEDHYPFTDYTFEQREDMILLLKIAVLGKMLREFDEARARRSGRAGAAAPGSGEVSKG